MKYKKILQDYCCWCRNCWNSSCIFFRNQWSKRFINWYCFTNIERDWSEPDRIVGELLQPGGIHALSELGMLGTQNT
jgi:hypothetical protein